MTSLEDEAVAEDSRTRDPYVHLRIEVKTETPHFRPAATIESVTSTDPVPAQANAGDEPLPVLTDVWQSGDGGDPDAGLSNAKVCRNARHFTFDGFAEDDEDIATSWRRLLEREGKSSPGGGSLRDLVLGPTAGD